MPGGMTNKIWKFFLTFKIDFLDLKKIRKIIQTYKNKILLIHIIK